MGKIGLSLITILGLLSLIQLFPRLSAAAKSPTDPDDPLTSSKFTVTNDGYLKVTDVMSACFLWRVQMSSGGSSKPNIQISDGLAEVVKPPEATLIPAEALTVPCTGQQFVGASAPYVQPVIAQADLAIVIYYRAWPFTFYRDRRLFRFVANIGKHGEVTWEKQPSSILEADFDNHWTVEDGKFVRVH